MSSSSLDIGDKVKIRLAGGGLIRGVIKGISWVFGTPSEYAVEISPGRVNYYKPYDLIKDTDDDIGYDCTCGADKAYSPHKPPGHAYHCDVVKLENRWRYD